MFGPDHAELIETPAGACVIATIHPSSILRIPDRDERHEAYAGFVADLTTAQKSLGRRRARRGAVNY
ncbi:MAG: hypothetical protein ACREQQ_03840 [Candidatus Binatia bacterium]